MMLLLLLLSVVTVTTWMLWLPVLGLRTLMGVIVTGILSSVGGVSGMFLTSGIVFRSSSCCCFHSSSSCTATMFSKLRQDKHNSRSGEGQKWSNSRVMLVGQSMVSGSGVIGLK